MKEFAFGKDGKVINIVAYGNLQEALEHAAEYEATDVFEVTPATYSATYDPKDITYDKLDIVTHKILFQLVNDVRALRGQGTITAAQYRAFVKGQMT